MGEAMVFWLSLVASIAILWPGRHALAPGRHRIISSLLFAASTTGAGLGFVLGASSFGGAAAALVVALALHGALWLRNEHPGSELARLRVGLDALAALAIFVGALGGTVLSAAIVGLSGGHSVAFAVSVGSLTLASAVGAGLGLATGSPRLSPILVSAGSLLTALGMLSQRFAGGALPATIAIVGLCYLLAAAEPGGLARLARRAVRSFTSAPRQTPKPATANLIYAVLPAVAAVLVSTWAAREGIRASHVITSLAVGALVSSVAVALRLVVSLRERKVLADHLETLVGRMREKEGHLSRQAFYDSLTGVANRSLFFTRAQSAIERAGREHRLICIAYLDLDNFKPINDQMGHTAGDQVLITAAQRLSAAVRPADTVGRIGGDEFAILIEDLVTPRYATDLAAKLLYTLSQPYEVNGNRVLLHASIGIAAVDGAVWSDRDVSVRFLIEEADSAMFAAKRLGKNRYVMADPARVADRAQRMAWGPQAKEPAVVVVPTDLSHSSLAPQPASSPTPADSSMPAEQLWIDHGENKQATPASPVAKEPAPLAPTDAQGISGALFAEVYGLEKSPENDISEIGFDLPSFD